jgi:hypothetical protein
MSDPVISLQPSRMDRATLRNVLAAHFALDRARSVRNAALPWLVAVEAVLLAIARWTNVLPAAAWAIATVAIAAAAVGIITSELRARIHFLKEFGNLHHA